MSWNKQGNLRFRNNKGALWPDENGLIHDGTQIGFTTTVSGVTPSSNEHLSTKKYIDDHTWTESDITDLDKYTQAEVDAKDTTLSGALHNEITALDYYTTGEVDSISGTLHNEIAALDYYTQAEVDSISGTLSAEIDSDIATHAADTTSVHGITDTSDLALKSGNVNQFADISSAGADIEDAVTKKHNRSHAITSTNDHTAGNWKLLYTDGSGNVQELAIGSDALYLKSTGPAGVPEWATASGGGGGGDVTKWTTVTVSGAGTTTLTTGDFGKTYVSIGTTAGQTRVFALPSVSDTDLGAHFRFVSTTVGDVTISGADSDVINESQAGGWLTTTSGDETCANVGLQLITETQWVVTGGTGWWQEDL